MKDSELGSDEQRTLINSKSKALALHLVEEYQKSKRPVAPLNDAESIADVEEIKMNSEIKTQPEDVASSNHDTGKDPTVQENEPSFTKSENSDAQEQI